MLFSAVFLLREQSETAQAAQMLQTNHASTRSKELPPNDALKEVTALAKRLFKRSMATTRNSASAIGGVRPTSRRRDAERRSSGNARASHALPRQAL